MLTSTCISSPSAMTAYSPVVSAALIEAKSDTVGDVPGKLRLMAAVSPRVVLEMTPDDARSLARWIDLGMQAKATVARARQHAADAELLGRLWAVMALAACAVAGLILLLKA